LFNNLINWQLYTRNN